MHAKGVVLGERMCFCLLSTFYKTLPTKNPSKDPVFTENPSQSPSKNSSKKHLLLENLLRTLLRVACCCMTPWCAPCLEALRAENHEKISLPGTREDFLRLFRAFWPGGPPDSNPKTIFGLFLTYKGYFYLLRLFEITF